MNGVQQKDETKDDNGLNGWSVWNDSPGYEYIIIKQGNYNANGNSNSLVDLYKYSDTGTYLQDLSAYTVTDEEGQTEYKISHITGYNQVPIPGTFLLLSSGLGLLFIRRRRQRV